MGVYMDFGTASGPVHGRRFSNSARPSSQARACEDTGWMDCQGASDKRKTLITGHVVQSSARLHRGRAEKGWKHACTERNLVRVRAADRLREGAPAEQGERHEHAALQQGRQREAPGHHLGRIRANRKQPQPRGVRERRLDEVDAQALIVRLQGRPWWTWRSAPPPWPPSSRSWTRSEWSLSSPLLRKT